MPDPALLGLSGSLRKASTNRKLVREAARLFGACGFTEANLRLPLYDGDLETEQGIPPEVQRLADQIKSADAVVISGPEYNKSISGVLKNALDWVSRTEGNPWAAKPVAIMSATAGRAGGERTQFALRLCLMPFNTRLIQQPEVLVAASSSAFDENDHLKDERYIKAMTSLMDALKAEIAR